MRIADLHRDGIAAANGGRFRGFALCRYGHCSLAAHDIVKFRQHGVQMWTDRGSWRKQQMIHISPWTGENCSIQSASVLNGSFATVHFAHWTKQIAREMHGHEYRYRIQRHIDARIPKIESVILAFHTADVDIHPLNRPVARIVDSVRMTHPAGSAGGTFQNGRASIDGKLGLPVENHEHLFAFVVEMMADPAFRLQDTSMQEIKVRVQRMAIEELQ